MRVAKQNGCSKTRNSRIAKLVQKVVYFFLKIVFRVTIHNALSKTRNQDVSRRLTMGTACLLES